MKKIILNDCYGGYHWSNKGLVEVMHRKHQNCRYIEEVWDNNKREYKMIEVSEKRFKELNPYDTAIEIVDPETNEYVSLNIYALRDDEDAIATLEKFGTAFCSAAGSRLVVEEYDETLFVLDGYTNYDGMERLDLSPNLTEKRLRECETVDEVIDILRRMDLLRKES